MKVAVCEDTDWLLSEEAFFEDKGYTGVEYHVVDGRMPCTIAVITKA